MPLKFSDPPFKLDKNFPLAVEFNHYIESFFVCKQQRETTLQIFDKIKMCLRNTQYNTGQSNRIYLDIGSVPYGEVSSIDQIFKMTHIIK